MCNNINRQKATCCFLFLFFLFVFVLIRCRVKRGVKEKPKYTTEKDDDNDGGDDDCGNERQFNEIQQFFFSRDVDDYDVVDDNE